MKLRIRDDTIRLRLGRSEVARVARGEAVWAATHVAGRVFAYGLVPDPSVTALAARFDGDRLTVHVPCDEARAWATGEAVGLSGAQAEPGGHRLALLVEKDFACLKPREGEDESDAFPHPDAGTHTC